MLSLDFNFVLEMINLVILYLLLRKFLIGPVMNIMEKRRAMIADGIQNANDQQARAMELKSQYEDALIQPPRGVLDIHMGEFAAGQR